MAGDWVKIRSDIYRDPKVSIIAESLMNSDGPLAAYVSQLCGCDMSVTRNVTRNATVGALVSVWGVMRHKGKRLGDDLVCEGVTVHVLDDVADLPGFGAAMESAGWVEKTEQGIVFRRFFEEHNVDPAERKKSAGADRQRRYRERKKGDSCDVTRDVTRDVTVTHREEKRREEKKAIIRPPSTDARLAEVTREAMAAYNEHAAATLGLARATEVGIERKQAHVRRCIKVARDACKAIYGSDTITPEFWADYFRVQAADDFIAGRTARSKEHANWRPDFEYLTRPDVITRAFERATQ